MRSDDAEESIDKVLDLIKSFQVDYQKSIVRQEKIWKNERVDRIPLLLQPSSIKGIDDFPGYRVIWRKENFPGWKSMICFLLKKKGLILVYSSDNEDEPERTINIWESLHKIHFDED